jgi:drug/metabolite transporter (DMT)-like permease
MSDAHKSDLLLVAVTLLAAISWVFSKEAILLMPPLLFMAVRFLIAGGFLICLAWPSLKRLSKDQFHRSASVGLVFGIAMSLWVMGLFHASSMGEGAFLTSLGVVIVPIIARAIFKEAQPASTWLAIPIAIAGLALLSLKNGFLLEASQLFFIAGATGFALYFTLITRLTNQTTIINRQGETIRKSKIPALPLTAIVLLVVGLVTIVESFFLEPWEATFTNPDPMLYWWVMASAIIGTAGRFLTQTYAQSLSVHSHGVVILILEPVWVALFAAGWFDETMSVIQLAGCALIFTALIVNRWSVLIKALKTWLGYRKIA